MRYLPEYYQESRQMKAIMEAVATHMPDVDGEMWKSFFVSLLSDKSLDLWRREFGVESQEELMARLRSTGMMNLEMLNFQGFTIHEPYRDMPEDGMILSEAGVMADGKEFMPLTTVIFTTPETLVVAKGLVRLMGLSGFQYLLSLAIEEYLCVQPGEMHENTRTIYTRITRLDETAEELSGHPIRREEQRTIYGEHHADARHRSWWSPNVFFTDSVQYRDTLSSMQYASVTQMN